MNEPTFDLKKFDSYAGGVILVTGTKHAVNNISKIVKNILPDISCKKLEHLDSMTGSSNCFNKGFALFPCVIQSKEQIQAYTASRNRLVRKIGGHKVCEIFKPLNIKEDVTSMILDIPQKEIVPALREYLDLTEVIRRIKPSFTHMENTYHYYELQETPDQVQIASILSFYLNAYNNSQLINYDELWTNFLITHQIYYRINANSKENDYVSPTLYCGDDCHTLCQNKDIRIKLQAYLEKQIARTPHGQVKPWHKNSITCYLEEQIEKTTRTADIAVINLNKMHSCDFAKKEKMKKEPAYSRHNLEAALNKARKLAGYSEECQYQFANILNALMHPAESAGYILAVNAEKTSVMALAIFNNLVRGLTNTYDIPDNNPISIPVWTTVAMLEHSGDKIQLSNAVKSFLNDCNKENCNHITVVYTKTGEMPAGMDAPEKTVNLSLKLPVEMTQEELGAMQSSAFLNEMKKWISENVKNHRTTSFKQILESNLF